MADGSYVIRFPDGDYEYVVSPTSAPRVGEKIERKRVVWTVTDVVENKPATVYVAPAPDSEGRFGGLKHDDAGREARRR
jgi:hypothetical protein